MIIAFGSAAEHRRIYGRIENIEGLPIDKGGSAAVKIINGESPGGNWSNTLVYEANSGDHYIELTEVELADLSFRDTVAWGFSAEDFRTSIVIPAQIMGIVVVTSGDSLRQWILTALAARMATITIANGYRTNVGASVFTWKAGPFLPAEVPGMDIRDSDTFRDETVGEQEHTLDINIRAISSGDSSPETIRQIQADIIEAVGSDLTFGGLADDTGTITAETIDVETADAVKTGCGVRFSIVYTTGRFAV